MALARYDRSLPRPPRRPLMARRGRLLGICLLLLGSIVLSLPARQARAGQAASSGQRGLPEKPANLKVLPADTSTRQLVAVMRSFSRALGVRCVHCHVGEDGADLSSVDFASDERPAKRKARVMMRMVRAINEQYLAELDRIGADGTQRLEVNCATCHHGQPRPLTLQQVLLQAHAEGGLPELFATYERLRQRYYGSWTYDFGEDTLVSVAGRLAATGAFDDALAVLQRNLELFPGSVTTLATQGQVHERAGDPEAARAAYRACLEANPQMRWCAQQLQRLQGS